jgi:hypothetical protein
MTDKTPDTRGSYSIVQLDETIKAAEARAYQRGYRAGQHRKAKATPVEKYQAQKDAFRRRAFLAALSGCVTAQGWTKGDKPINSVPSRTALASDFAEEAMKLYR